MDETLRRHDRSELGETLIEVLISIVVMGAVFGAFFSAIATTSTATKSHRYFVTAGGCQIVDVWPRVNGW